jgi:uncharacterized membrane protein YfcA
VAGRREVALLADRTVALVLVVLFVATLVRSALGFGEALVAVPLLALLIPIEEAAPLAALVSITVAALILARDWRHVQVRSAGRLVLATLLGIPLGLVLLIRADERLVKAILGAVIIAFSGYCLICRNPPQLKDDRFAWCFGFAAGALGGAYGMNGPPLVVYGSLRGWSPEHFRATLQGYFLLASVAGFCGYGLAGLWVPSVSYYYVASLPAVLGAVLLGRTFGQRLHRHLFVMSVHIVLVAIGAMLLVQSLPLPHFAAHE